MEESKNIEIRLIVFMLSDNGVTIVKFEFTPN